MTEGRETLPGDITLDMFTSYVHTANLRLSPFDFEIRSSLSQKSSNDNRRQRLWAFVNTTSDALTQLATTHSADEIAFVKRVLDGMFETYNAGDREGRKEIMAIKGTQALQLCKASRNPNTQNGDLSELGAGSSTQAQSATQAASASSGSLTMREAEKVLKSMVEEGWFELSRDGYYSLTPRALMELRGWLVETYNEESDEEEGIEGVRRIKFCEACRDIVTIGQRCSKSTCPCRLHNGCTTQFFRNATNPTCPLCQSEWTGSDFVGERAVTMGGNSGNRNRRTNGAANGRASTSRANGRLEADEGGGDEEDE